MPAARSLVARVAIGHGELAVPRVHGAVRSRVRAQGLRLCMCIYRYIQTSQIYSKSKTHICVYTYIFKHLRYIQTFKIYSNI